MFYLMIISAVLASISQILLKSSAIGRHRSALQELLNPKVITAYFLLFLSMFLNILAFRTVSYKWGPVIASSSYIFVLILSMLIFHEKMNRNKFIGTVFILAGIVVFGL